jgi:hypothetical protein
MCTNIADSSVFPDKSLQSWSISRLIIFSQFKITDHQMVELWLTSMDKSRPNIAGGF